MARYDNIQKIITADSYSATIWENLPTIIINSEFEVLIFNSKCKTLFHMLNSGDKFKSLFSKNFMLPESDVLSQLDKKHIWIGKITYRVRGPAWSELIVNKTLNKHGLILVKVCIYPDLVNTKKYVDNVTAQLKAPIVDIFTSMPTLDSACAHYHSCILGNGIKQQVTRLRNVVNAVLDFKVLLAHDIKLANAPFDILQLLNECINLVLKSIQPKKIIIKLEIAENGQSTYVGDPSKICQVLTNIISNAAKYSRDNSEVIIKISTSPFQTDPYKKISFTISDNGMGIPRSEQDKIFTPFPKIKKENVYEQGIGLGLATSKVIIETLRGDIWFESKENTGTSFYFYIVAEAICTDQIPSYIVETQRIKQNIKQHKILIVDDNTINQQICSNMLKSLGQSPDIVENGKEAVDAFNANGYELIFMDMDMPIMGGIDATKEIRKIQMDRPPYIVALTANDLPGDREKCLQAGMNDFLSKPAYVGALENILTTLSNKCGDNQYRLEIPFYDAPDNEKSKTSQKYDIKIIDIAKILEMFKNDEHILLITVELYLKKYGGMLFNIEQALDTSDEKSLIRHVLLLKSAISMFYAVTVDEPITQLEKMGRSNSLMGAKEVFHKLCQIIIIMNRELTFLQTSSVRKSN